MYAAMLVRVGSEVLHSVMGGFSLFCLYYAGKVTEYHLALYLVTHGLEWGALAAVIVYCKERYLES